MSVCFVTTRGIELEEIWRRTVKVAQELLRRMERQKILVGIGVHSGVAYFGAMGTAEGLTDISAIGDEVNTAVRLASNAAAGEIIVSEPVEVRVMHRL